MPKIVQQMGPHARQVEVCERDLRELVRCRPDEILDIIKFDRNTNKITVNIFIDENGSTAKE